MVQWVTRSEFKQESDDDDGDHDSHGGHASEPEIEFIGSSSDNVARKGTQGPRLRTLHEAGLEPVPANQPRTTTRRRQAANFMETLTQHLDPEARSARDDLRFARSELREARMRIEKLEDRQRELERELARAERENTMLQAELRTLQLLQRVAPQWDENERPSGRLGYFGVSGRARPRSPSHLHDAPLHPPPRRVFTAPSSYRDEYGLDDYTPTRTSRHSGPARSSPAASALGEHELSGPTSTFVLTAASCSLRS